MKILKFLLMILICGFFSISIKAQKISELPAASSIAGDNLFVIVQNGITKKITYSLFSEGGGITGSGVAGQISYWSGTNSLTGSTGLTFDETDLSLGGAIFVNSPGNLKISSNGTSALFESLVNNGNIELKGINASTGVHAFFWDGALNRIGIGTNTPSTYFEVNGNTKIVGSLNINGAYTLPTVDGSSKQVLQTNGDGSVSWQNSSGGGTVLWETSGSNVQLIDADTVSMQSERIIDLAPSLWGTDAASKDIAELEADLYTKTFASAGNANDEFPNLDIAEFSQASFSTYTHIGCCTYNVYNPVNGVMLSIYGVGTHHVTPPKKFYYRKSTDGGATWGAQAELPMTYSASYSYINGCVDYTSDGRLIMLYDKYNGTSHTGMYSIYSDNDGASWSSEVSVSIPSGMDYAVSSITNNLLEFDNGNLAAPYYASDGTDAYFGLFISDDNGLTFDSYKNYGPTGVPYADESEIDVIQLSNGIIIAMTRPQNDSTRFRQYISYDYGDNWTYQGNPTFDTVIVTQSGSAHAMIPKFAEVNIYGRKTICLYCTNREDENVKRIFALPEDLMGANGHLGWNYNTLNTFHSWAGTGSSYDGNGTPCHPNGNFRGLFGAEDQSVTWSTATVYIFKTPNDIDEVSRWLGISNNGVSVTGDGVPGFIPHTIGQIYTDTTNTKIYYAENVTVSGDWSEIAGSGGGDVTKVGTPVNNQIGVWTGDGTIEGATDFEFNGTALEVGAGTGHKIGIGMTPTVSFNIFASGSYKPEQRFHDGDISTIPTYTSGFDPDVTSDMIGLIGIAASSYGGLNFIGLTSNSVADAIALIFTGCNGYTGTVTGSPVVFRAAKNTGVPALGAMASGEPCFDFRNWTTTLATFYTDEFELKTGVDLKITSGEFILTSPTVPGNASSTGITGTISWDANYIYVCTATNTWKRVAISAW